METLIIPLVLIRPVGESFITLKTIDGDLSLEYEWLIICFSINDDLGITNNRKCNSSLFFTRNKKKENIDYTKGLKSGEQDISEFIKKYHFEENKKREEELVIRGTKKREEREKWRRNRKNSQSVTFSRGRRERGKNKLTQRPIISFKQKTTISYYSCGYHFNFYFNIQKC